MSRIKVYACPDANGELFEWSQEPFAGYTHHGEVVDIRAVVPDTAEKILGDLQADRDKWKAIAAKMAEALSLIEKTPAQTNTEKRMGKCAFDALEEFWRMGAG